MSNNLQQKPFVSFIIPTYNAAKLLPCCLQSIRKQNYPQDRYEILVVDGKSQDQTREIAKKFKAKVIDNPQVDPETAKSLGIQNAKGTIIALMDSDNEIVKNDWLEKMVKPLMIDPGLFGVESFYFPRSGENIFNTYALIIHVADPFSRCLASRLHQEEKSGYIEYTIPKGGRYPLGANGFLWNRKIIEEVGLYKPKFEESNFGYFVLEKGYRKFARIPGYGIYHQHISSFSEFIGKRLKIGNKFLRRREEKKRTWLEGVSPIRFFLCTLYCGTFVGPLLEGLYFYIITGYLAWLLHPFMSFLSVVAYAVVLARRRLRAIIG